MGAGSGVCHARVGCHRDWCATWMGWQGGCQGGCQPSCHSLIRRRRLEDLRRCVNTSGARRPLLNLHRLSSLTLLEEHEHLVLCLWQVFIGRTGQLGQDSADFLHFYEIQVCRLKFESQISVVCSSLSRYSESEPLPSVPD